MYTIPVHNRIDQVIAVFTYIGLWNGNKRNHFRIFCSIFCLKLWYLVSYGYLPISILAGALTSDNEVETIFLGVISISALVQAFRLYYFLWEEKEIKILIRKTCTHSINNSEEYGRVKNKIEVFMKYASYYNFMILCGAVTVIMLTLPIISNEKRLPMNIYFPFNWKNSELLYWMALSFVVYEVMLSVVCAFFNTFIWYLMMSCATKYEILGNKLKNLGLVTEATSSKKKISVAEKQVASLAVLIALIKEHQMLQRTTYQLKSCFSNLFLIQIGTSGVSICGSVYALAFSSAINPFEYGVYIIGMLYNFFDIFMVTYFGNEIIFSSSHLSYCLFECNWIEQTETYDKCVFILMEVLKRPETLVVGKLYSLDLQIFTKILNFAYSMFNILKSLN